MDILYFVFLMHFQQAFKVIQNTVLFRRATPLRVNPKMRNVRAVYKTHIDVVHYRKLDNKRLAETGKDDG